MVGTGRATEKGMAMTGMLISGLGRVDSSNMEFICLNKNNVLEKSFCYVSQAASSHLSFIDIMGVSTTHFAIDTNMHNELFTILRPIIIMCNDSIMCFFNKG